MLKCLLFLFVVSLLGNDAVLHAANLNSPSLSGPTVVPEGYFEVPAITTLSGFQYNPTGGLWTFANRSGLTRNKTGFTNGNPPAPQGNQVLFLQMAGHASIPNVKFAAGHYRFDLMAAQRGNHQASSQTFELWIDGQSVHSFTPAGTAYQAMSTGAIYLSSGNHTLELRGMNPNGGDNTAFVDEFTYTRMPAFSSGFEDPKVTAPAGYEFRPAGGPWTFAGAAGLSRNNTAFTNGNPPAPEGDQVLFLKSTGSVTRDIVIDHAGFYRVRFKAALRGNNQHDGEVKNIRVSLNSIVIGELSLPDFNYNEMVTLTTYLNAGTYPLKLQGVNPVPGDHTGFIDDLRLEMVPDWQDPYTWGGQVPGSGDIVTIPAGSAVAMHGTMVADRVIVNGDLVAAQSHDLDLSTKNILIAGNTALMEIGSELITYPGDALITLTAAATDPGVPGAPGNNFIAARFQGTLHLHGTETLSWTQLAATANAGATQITLNDPITWPIGDKILITSSHKDWEEAEERTIMGITGFSNVVTLDQPLTYKHLGVVQNYTNGTQSWDVDLRAEVGRLNRNITIQGSAAAAQDSFGGHIMIDSISYGYASGIELYHMGQTGILGRYPWHWHRLDDLGAGQYLKNSSVHRSFSRGVTIHATDSTLVENNFFYDHLGHCVFLEDGVERFNVIRRNLVLGTRRPKPGDELTPSDNERDEIQNRTPSSYWITNPQNTFEDNVAAGTEGSGFWFAFPKTPMGASANDSRFQGMEPYTLDLISFRRNRAHGCRTGFDVFDQLTVGHSIIPNGGWANSNLHLIADCEWYANDLGLYTGGGGGGPTDNLIFRNNALVENQNGTMFASSSIVDSSLWVAKSGEGLINGQRHAYRVYDGPGQVYDSYFVNWNDSQANLLRNNGAAFKRPNHLFGGNTTNHSGLVRLVLPNFDLPPAVPTGGRKLPHYWSVVVRDLTGGLTGIPNTNIVSNHPWMLVGDEIDPAEWTRAFISSHEYAFTFLKHDLPSALNPDIVATREKTGTPTEHVYHPGNNKQQFHVIVNEDFLYSYEYVDLPSSKVLHLIFRNAHNGDECVHRLKDFGKLGGLNVTTTGTLQVYTSLASLQAGTNAGYFVETGGDLYVKAVSDGETQSYDITWTTDFVVGILDTDGDQMSDEDEMAAVRHPFDASDLAAEFEDAGELEGWDVFVNVTNPTVANGKLSGESTGDAQIRNNDYNFSAAEVPNLYVNMRADLNTAVMFFYATSNSPGFSGARRLVANYTGGGNYQTLSFNAVGDTAWKDTITALRLDPVWGANNDFDIEWIRAFNTAKVAAPAAEQESPTAAVRFFPNPFSGTLNIDLGAAGSYRRVEISDLMGRQLRSIPVPADARQLTLEQEIAGLSPGIYLVGVAGDAERVTFRMVKR